VNNLAIAIAGVAEKEKLAGWRRVISDKRFFCKRQSVMEN
jgi:hypothetical protein